MDRNEIKQFVREVVGPAAEMIDSEKWVSICCPLSEFTHEKGKDKTPSSGISVKPGGVSIFNCFTCHKRGPLHWLLRELERYTGDDWDEYAESIEAGEFFGGRIPKWGEEPTDSAPPQPIDSEVYTDLYDSAVGHPYLRERGISNTAAKRMGLLHDPGDQRRDERILFPVYDRSGQLFGFSGRAVHAEAKLKVKDYFGLPKRHMLLGAQLIQEEDEYVILVEGLVDVARMVTFEQPALGFMSSTLTPMQAEIVKDIGKPVYFFHDNDRAGEDARDKAKELLWRHVPVMKVRYPKEHTFVTRSGDSRPPKDPAELTEKQVREMIADARML